LNLTARKKEKEGDNPWKNERDLNRSVLKETTPTGSDSHNLSFFYAKRGPRLLPTGTESKRKAEVQRIERSSVHYL